MSKDKSLTSIGQNLWLLKDPSSEYSSHNPIYAFPESLEKKVKYDFEVVSSTKAKDVNPFLELEFEELFSLPIDTQSEQTDNLSTAMDEINALPSPASGGAQQGSVALFSIYTDQSIILHHIDTAEINSFSRNVELQKFNQINTQVDYLPFVDSDSGINISDQNNQNNSCPSDVTTFSDIVDQNDGEISLREAIDIANSHPDITEIHLCPGHYEIELLGRNEELNKTGDLDIHTHIKIIGHDRENTIIDANGLDRIFHVFEDARLELENVTIINGDVNNFSGGALYNSGYTELSNVSLVNNQARVGGAVYNAYLKTINIENSIIAENHASLYGGGIWNNNGQLSLLKSALNYNIAGVHGGAISNQSGDIFIEKSTLNDNQSGLLGGGIINFFGDFDINTSTLSSNVAGYFGGAITTIYGQNLNIINSTLVENIANISGSGIFSIQPFSSNLLNITSNIIAKNNNDIDISGQGINSQGYNLIGNVDTISLIPNTDDQFGSLSGVSPTGHVGAIDPFILPLNDNGGVTLTHGLDDDSPAVDSGNPEDLSSDQRGFDINLIRDIGAFEKDGLITPIILDLNFDGIDLIAPEESQVNIIDLQTVSSWSVGWVGPDDAFLVYDFNLDGQVSSLYELAFSNYHPLATTDLQGLALFFDGNQDHWIDSQDEIYQNLRIWQDKNSNGQVDEKEWFTLEEKSIYGLDLQAQRTQEFVNNNIVFHKGKLLSEEETDYYDVGLSLNQLNQGSGLTLRDIFSDMPDDIDKLEFLDLNPSIHNEIILSEAHSPNAPTSYFSSSLAMIMAALHDFEEQNHTDLIL